MKKTLLLTTALLACAGQASAQDFRLVREPVQSAGPSFGMIASGALLVGVAVALAGGKGDGEGDGDDDDGGNGPTDPLPDPDGGPRQGPTAPRDSFNTVEYQRNWGIDAIHADARYADGGTGLGAILGVFDSGLDRSHTDLTNQVAYSYSYYTLDNDVTDEIGHGTHVGGIVAAEKNDLGTHGVAYDAQLAVFKALGSSEPLAMDFFDAWADANHKAADMGASAMNHSWNFVHNDDSTITVDEITSRQQAEFYFGETLLESFDYAIEKDMISVFAAGNSGLDNAGNQAALALYFPEYSDHVLSVVAIDANDQIASFSNRCGLAADFCIAAPGVNILSTTPDDTLGYKSGTSMAAPFVTGAIGLLASNFPELTGAEITTILKDTARDLGAIGVDEIYGHGALDLENAMAPQGTISFQSSTTLGADTHSVARSHISSGGGMAAALQSALSEQKVIVTDGYDRAYSTNLGVFVGEGEDISRDKKVLDLFSKGTKTAMRMEGDGSRLAYSRHGIGALGGEGTIDPSFDAPYASLLEDASAMRYSAGLGGAEISVSAAAGSLMDLDDNGRYLAIEARAPIGAHALTLGMGQLRENDAFLGTDVSGAFGEALETETAFLTLKGDFALDADSSLSITGSLGRSAIGGDGMIQGGQIMTQSLGVGYGHSGAFSRGDRLQVSVSQQMNVSSGEMNLRVPTALAASVDGVRSSDVTQSETAIDMAGSQAPIDMKIGYEIPLAGGRLAIAGAMRSGDARHRIASIGYTLRF